MSIVSDEHNKTYYPRYRPPSALATLVAFGEIENLFERFCDKIGKDVSRFFVDREKIYDVLTRVDQRKLHYKMYHDGVIINELKEVATLAYWIVRFKPWVYLNEEDNYETSNANELFAMYAIISTINSYRSCQSLPAFMLSSRISNDFLYTLETRLISIDEMVLLVDALAHQGVS